MRRKAFAATGLGAVGALLLASCSSQALVDMSTPLSDGTFTGSSNPDEQGAVGTVKITVAGGRIVDTSYQTLTATGSVKDESYGMGTSGAGTNSDYYERAQAAVRSYPQYSAKLTEVQDPTKVDVISGATVAHSQFLQAALRAVYAAQGVPDDGRADSVNMPSLNLDDENF